MPKYADRVKETTYEFVDTDKIVSFIGYSRTVSFEGIDKIRSFIDKER